LAASFRFSGVSAVQPTVTCYRGAFVFFVPLHPQVEGILFRQATFNRKIDLQILIRRDRTSSPDALTLGKSVCFGAESIISSSLIDKLRSTRRKAIAFY